MKKIHSRWLECAGRQYQLIKMVILPDVLEVLTVDRKYDNYNNGKYFPKQRKGNILKIYGGEGK